MFKNQSPRQLSFYAAITSSIAVAGLVFFLGLLGLFKISFRGLGILFILVFCIDYFANYFFIRHYLFRKIKLIYKVIHKHKIPADFKADKIDMTRTVLEDVEREVAEWSIQHAEELEEVKRMATYRRRFLSDVSHELKTPIFNIQGFIHTLLDGAINDPEVNAKYLQRAAKNIDRLQMIVEDLETINKLEAGRMEFDLREFDLHELAEDVFNDLEMKAKERHIRLMFKDGADQHFRARADQEAIRQVLINLVHNSIKYGREGGMTKVSFYDMESFILIEVSDNGLGIAPEHLPHVFDRFYRIDKSRSREAGGTGLGLAIVKHIVEAHKQTITVRSTVGQGSTFGFTVEKA